ncbi:MAG: hydantoinase [Candidatus Melainabacteria bacterium]|nr:hydantoinase [Candidatus Melainabacteria bacterium]
MTQESRPDPKLKSKASANAKSKVRVGIDVGGTFTHAVALDAESLEMIEKVKVHTTHTAREGVAKGIIDALQLLLAKASIEPARVAFIAHSTTQATNALLEGDVAAVGIIGMGGGLNSFMANLSTQVGKIELAPGKFLKTFHRFVDTTQAPKDEVLVTAIDELIKQGAVAIAASEAFSVDNSDNEKRVVELARSKGILATCGSEVSQLYGLKVRTRTAVINASMLPRMLESANMTEKSVREAGIKAPLMIMRSDGGVMDIAAMRERPILTMLSGPAAGVAAAMMFLHISDGIFLEVGGTSTDISAIVNGKARIKSGEIGGHRIYTNTLDVRTVGVAGGSMPRIRTGSPGDVIDVGPRSAHIAGLRYVSFASGPMSLKSELIQPFDGDPKDYLALIDSEIEPGEEKPEHTTRYTLTPTCASNYLRLVSDEDCAKGNNEAISFAFDSLSKELNTEPKKLANDMLTLATSKAENVILALIKDNKLDRSMVTLVGGGGGAAAIVPFLAEKMKLRHKLSQHSDVVSAIGVALALIRETVERQVVNPTNDDILKLRDEAQTAVLKMGADPASIEIHVEIDSRANIVRATACGATSVTDTDKLKKDLSDEDKLHLAAESMHAQSSAVSLKAGTDHFSVYGGKVMASKFFGMLQSELNPIRVIDRSGNIRLQVKDGDCLVTTPSESGRAINQLVEMHSQWGDAGKVIPSIFLLSGPKLVDLSGLMDASQVTTLSAPEVEKLPADAKVVAIASIDR